MNNSPSREQLMMVAIQCSGYDSLCSNVINTVGAENSMSCENCYHWKNHKCSIDLFDPVLTSIDQE